MSAHPVVLMYHDVIDPSHPEASGFPSPDAAAYKLSRPQFEEHLRAMQAAASRSGAGVVERPEDLSAPPRLVLTFDDAGVSFYDPIAPLLEEAGWRGQCFVPTKFLNTPGFLSTAQVRELHRRGHVMGSHSHSHPMVMSACSPSQLLAEWRDSLAALSGILGAAVRVASVPGGYYSEAVGRAAAASGIRVLFNSEPTLARHSVDGCLVLGRFMITNRTTTAHCAALAGGRRWPRWQQQLLWSAKKTMKRAALPVYLKVRQRLLR